MNGTFGFTVKSGSPAGNTLTLSGTASGNTMSGNWTLTEAPVARGPARLR